MQPYRIGILTSGGDCPGLNAVIRAVVRVANSKGWEVLGFSDGYEGLLSPVRYRILDRSNTSGIMSSGGTILGTTNRGRFVAKVGLGNVAKIPPEIINEARHTLEGLNVQALVCIGGDGSLTTAQQLFEEGIPTVGVPKTIDNDLAATAMTFGFDSAVECVADACDRLHTTATSHQRIMVLEVMGRHAGWIALHGGLSGGADIILIPEIPFSYDKIQQVIEQRIADGAKSTMIVVAEGAAPQGMAAMGTENKGGEKKLGGIGQHVTDVLAKLNDREVRCCVLGHLQRGGDPTTLDRLLGSRFGVEAVNIIAEKKFGYMVSYQNYHVGSVPIQEAVGHLKRVNPKDQIVQTALALGVSFGN